jgi:hypothetical protein
VSTCETESGFLSRFGTVLFYLIAVIIGAQYGIFTHLKHWIGDFYHHAAFIRQLKSTPFELGNPFFEGPPVYTLYWPYEYLISLISNFSGLSPHESLALFGFINLCLLFLVIKKFALRINASPLMPSLSLLLVLLLWPGDPLNFSSFYSLTTIFFVASYPATFAFILSLACILIATSPSPKTSYKIIIAVLSLLVILIHPITFMFLGATLGSIWIAKGRSCLRDLTIPTALLLALILAYFWPFFPLSELIFGKTFSADPNGYAVYKNFLQRYWPTLLAIPLVVLRLRQNRADFLSLAFIGLYILYGLGYLLGIWNLGRSIAFIMFISQILSADFIINFCKWYGKKCNCVFSPVYTTLILLILFLKLSLVSWGWIDYTLQNPPTLYQDAKEVAAQIKEGSTVIAPPDISLALPSFGIKVIVFNTPPFFGESFTKRNEDLRKFFTPESNNERRAEIIKTYQAKNFIIPNGHPIIDPLLQPGFTKGVVFFNQRYVVIESN